MDAMLVISLILTGMFLGYATLVFTVFYCIKKQDGTLIRETLAGFLKELGDAMLPTRDADKITKIS
jgi:hypothetical protein